ncbi:superoxide dismutase [Epidermidibacterium keratini]|uniref:Superoxide dismutase n=1 Tax=Epidermidibacterium keratini TaxID=1891644 RepID=A0A7L4YMJ1_9ACTN|nr:superoxide dismutase [Epidermidibacterium keratini]QHC00366.1 superoxide dismutase [Epidermidibacterium keratini]
MAVYTLPDLPYDYSALEPHIDAQIMELHHDKHHKKYVDDANTALEKLAEARDKGDFATIPKLEKDLAFNLGGHTNHSVFWTNMSPDGGGKPTGELAAAIDQHFGSFEAFQGQFEAAATTIQGSGWAMLVWDSIGQQPLIVQLYDQQSNVPLGLTPILLLDMWEHAFYLQYKNVKADYAKAWWNVVNWEDAAARFAAAQQQTQGLIVK